jgi:3-oxoacyl-[acyl-carrier-protein] synthase III
METEQPRVRTRDLCIAGLGVFLPETVSVAWAVAHGRYPEAEAELHELASVAVAGEMPAPEMALRAARQALDRSGCAPSDVDLLLYADSWHQGPDGWNPHHYLQRHLLGDAVLAVELRNGCNGMFSALQLASGYLDGAPGRRTALLIAADNFGTPLLDRWRMGPGYIAGDGASAVLLRTGAGEVRLRSVVSSTVTEAEEIHRCGQPLFPPGPTLGRALDFAERGAEFRRRSIASGAGTTALLEVQRRTMQVVAQALAEAGVRTGDLARVAYMNYAREIVEQRCMVALGLDMDRSTWDFGRTVGHLGASDQIVALEHLLAGGQLNPGEHVLLLGVGPGVTVSAAVVRVGQSPSTVEPSASAGEDEHAGQ